MKYIKVIVGLGLIPLCIFIGSHITLGGGNGAILGGILGAILCCIVIGFRPQGKIGYWPDSNSPDEHYQIKNNANTQEINKTLKIVQEAQLEEHIRNTSGYYHR